MSTFGTLRGRRRNAESLGAHFDGQRKEVPLPDAKAQYIASLIVVVFALTAWVLIERLLGGTWVSMSQALPMAAFFGAMALFTVYRRLHGLDPTPAWLMIIVGMVGIAVYAYWVRSDNRPTSALDWFGFALLAAVPVGLLLAGLRRSRRA